MRDIWDSLKWNERVIENGFLNENEPLNLVIALSCDGVNPFRKNVNHSTWPIMASILNYPVQIRNKFNRLLLLGLIPGPDQPKQLTTYMRMIVDEMNELYA